MTRKTSTVNSINDFVDAITTMSEARPLDGDDSKESRDGCQHCDICIFNNPEAKSECHYLNALRIKYKK